MDLHEAIEKRFSVRSYEAKDVEEERLTRVLDAGRIAPSARNLQPWKFVVVRDEGRRRRLAELSGQSFLAEAPVVIAVVGMSPQRVMFCDVPADPVDCAIAIDHMTLAAVAEGLGTCWIGHFPQDECRELLAVPQSAKIIELLALGYPSVGPPRKKNRKPLSEVVCHEKFS
ncbi:MAG: nitroreductase family protein [Planctomycetota bacterium]|jgi:nitroreductase